MRVLCCNDLRPLLLKPFVRTRCRRSAPLQSTLNPADGTRLNTDRDEKKLSRGDLLLSVRALTER
jgi:hypothetical protein